VCSQVGAWRLPRALGIVLLLVTSACAGDDALTSESEGESDAGGESDTGMIDEGPWDSLAERPCPEDSILDGNNFGVPFFLTHCNGCHSDGLPEDERQGAPAAVNFNTLDDVRGQDDRIWARAADHNLTMPPVDSVPADARVQLGEWLACGAPLTLGE
jgi:hypothetical protein